MSTLLGDARVRIRPDLTSFQSAAQSGIGTSLAKVGKLAGVAMGAAAVVGFAVSTLNIGKQYQATLNNLQAVSQASASQMAAVGREAKALGSDLTLTSTSAADAATAMTELAKGGLSVDEAMTAARGTLQLAAAAGVSAADAATLQSAALNGFNLEASQAGRVADVLANAANAASGEITDFGQGMAQASAVAAATGISLEDTAATLGILANNGIKGSDAGTLLKSALLALQSPSKPATIAMEQLSLSAYDAAGNFVGLSSVFGQLAESQRRLTPQAYAAATSTLFGSDAARLAGIAGREGSEGFDAMAEAMGKSGSAAEVAAAKAKGVAGAFEAFKSQLETIQIDIFEQMAPGMETIIRLAAKMLAVVGDLAGIFADLPGPIQIATVALVAWRIAGGRVVETVGNIRDRMKNFGEHLTVQQALYRQQTSGLSDMQRAFGELGTGARTTGDSLSAAQRQLRGWDEHLAGTTVHLDAVTTSTSRISTAMGGAVSAVGRFARAIGPDLGVAVAVATVAFLVTELYEVASASAEAASAAESLAGALTLTDKAADRKVIRQTIEDTDGLAEALQRAGVSSDIAIKGLLGNAAAQDKVTGAFQTYLTTHRQGQNMTDDQKVVRQAINDYNELATGYGNAASNARYFAEESTDAGGAVAGTTPEIEAAAEAIAEWRTQLQGLAAGFVDPLGTYSEMVEAAATLTAEQTSDASDSWRDYVDDVDVSLDELADRLEEQITAQENWRANLGLVAQWAGADVASHLAAMGEEGVGLVAAMADGTSAEAQRMAALIKEDIRLGGGEWTAQLDTEMKNVQAIASLGAARTVAGIAYELGLGVDQVADIANRYGIVLADGINPLLGALGQRTVSILKRGTKPNSGSLNGPGFRDGGYTGDGPADEPKGVVHGGEFVFTKEETRRAGVVQLAEYAKSLRGYKIGGFVTSDDVPRPSSTAPFGSPLSTAADGVMSKSYSEVVSWLKANAEATQGGTAGAGAVGGSWASLWSLVKRQIPQARINSTFRPGDPGYHGKGKAIDFGFGVGPGGAGSAGLASINRLLHDQVGRNLAELIYTGIGDDRPDLKNGRPLVYSAATRAQHRNHVHAAVYDSGGVLDPGMTLVDNRSSKPEGVLNNDQLGWLKAAADGGSAPLIGGDLVLQATPGRSVRDQMEEAMFELRRIKRGGRRP